MGAGPRAWRDAPAGSTHRGRGARAHPSRARPIVVYCWGPGCNGATRAALEFARLGHPVKEMLGGFEYWVREGFAYDTADGLMQRPADALTNVAAAGLGGAPAAPRAGRSDQLRLLSARLAPAPATAVGPRRRIATVSIR